MDQERQNGEKVMPGWYLCAICNDPVREGMEQHDEEGRLLCPWCFLHLAPEDAFEVPKKK